MAKASKSAAQKETGKAGAAQVAERFKVKEVFENSKGEFFTSYNLAVLSENGKKDNVTTYSFPEAKKNDPPADSDDKKAAAAPKSGKAKAAAEKVEGQSEEPQL